MDLDAIDRREALILSRFAPEEPSGTYRRGGLATARWVLVRFASRLFRRALLAVARVLARLHLASRKLAERFQPAPIPLVRSRVAVSRIATR